MTEIYDHANHDFETFYNVTRFVLLHLVSHIK